MFTERTSVGLDVHARSVVAAAIDTHTGKTKTARLVPSHEVVLEWVRELPGPVAACYEAGPTGYGLYRAFVAAGIRCEVAAPSKIVRPAGDRVKTDAKDALLLARLLRMDEIVSGDEERIAEGNVHLCSLGDPKRVIACNLYLGEELAHLGCRLQVMVVSVELEPVRITHQ